VEEYRLIPLAQLREPSNPIRSAFDEDAMMELARSIGANGLKQPLRVLPLDDGTFEVRVGHRRLLACRMVGKLEVPCIVDDEASTIDAEQIAENADREDMSPVDEARRYRRLFDANGQDVDKVCELVKRGRARVEDRLLLLQGDPKVLEQLELGKIVLGVAQELNRITDPDKRLFHMDWAIRSGCSVAQMRDWRNRANATSEAEALAPARPSPSAAAPPPEAASNPYEVPFAAIAPTSAFSSSLEPRLCPFCKQTFPEYQMFKVFVCGDDANHYLKPLMAAKSG
jgi:ParB family chromosome partitioning protein